MINIWNNAETGELNFAMVDAFIYASLYYEPVISINNQPEGKNLSSLYLGYNRNNFESVISNLSLPDLAEVVGELEQNKDFNIKVIDKIVPTHDYWMEMLHCVSYS